MTPRLECSSSLESAPAPWVRPEEPCTIHAACPEAVLCAQARIRLPLASDRVFDGLRNLACLADWWPGATGIAALPPGVYGAGDAALLRLGPDRARVHVIAYKPGRRIVLSVCLPIGRVLVDLRVRGDERTTMLTLAIESPRASTLLAQTLQGLRLRKLCRDAGARLERHLRQSPTSNPAAPAGSRRP